MWKYLIPMLLVGTPALADPVSAAVAIISTSFTAATTGAFLFGSAFYHFAAVYALSELGKALQPDAPTLDKVTRGYDVAGISPAAPHQIIYGEAKVGGVIVFKETTDDDKFLHIVTAIAGHECETVSAVYFDDDELTIGFWFAPTSPVVAGPSKYFGGDQSISDYRALVYKTNLGAQTTAESALVSASSRWTNAHILEGVAYIYTKLIFDADVWVNGEPNQSFVVKGKKLYDPRTGSSAYSNNPALAIRDFLTSEYGLNVSDDEIDDTSFTTAANICDETVSLQAGGTEKRYTVNGAFLTDTAPQTILDDLTRAMAGSLWYSQGKFRVKAGAYTSPVLALDEDDNRSNIQIKTRTSRRDNFNAVTGRYKGEETDYITTDFRKITSTTFLQADGNLENIADINLPFTATSTMAQRIAKIMLYRNREQITLSGSFGMRAFALEVGDVVTYTNSHMGFSSKPFEVTGWTFQPMGDGTIEVQLTLQEVSSGVYDAYADEVVFERNNTELAGPFTVPTVGLSLEQDTRIINEHVVSLIRATVTANTDEISRVDYVEAEYKLSSDTTYNQLGVGELGIFEAIDIPNGIYDVRARAINTFGRKGDYTTGQINLQAQVAAPSDVDVFSANVNGAVTTLEWEPVADLDLSHYKIRHAVETTGATFAHATTSFDKVPRPATSVTVPARSGTYMIRPVDKLGIPAENYTSVTVEAAQLNQYTTTQTATEHTSFSGTKTNTYLYGSPNKLRILGTSNPPRTGTYVFANDIDTGAVRQVYATLYAKTERHDPSTPQWDDLSGNIDSLAGLWDDLTANPQFADTDIKYFISMTDDDPSGSPTWSAYQRFKAGQFSGRAFRFKIELQTETVSVSPLISELYATVEY